MARYIPIGQPINRAEEDGMRALRDTLPEHFLVVGNFELQLPQRANTLEYDAVVVGEHGLYAVEIKGWSGVIDGDIRRWQLEWGPVENPFIRIERKAKVLRHLLATSVEGFPSEVFCQAVVLLPDDADVRVDDPRNERIVTVSNLYDLFVDRDLIRQNGPGPLLDEALRDRIEKCLVPIAEPVEPIPVLRDYDVEAELQIDEDAPYRELVGRHRLLRSRKRVRIKMYSLDPLATASEQKRQYDRVLRDMEALSSLETNPYIANAYELIRDHDDELRFYVVSEWVGPQTLAQYLADSDPGDLPHRLTLGAHLARAVSFMHARGIVHRNLHPGVIYMTEDPADDVPLKIADFDYARITTLPSIASNLDNLGTEGFVAPEIWQSDDYDERVDTFSLGALFFYLITGERLFRSLKQLIHPENVWAERSSLIADPDLRSLVRDMVDPDPSSRLGNLQRAVDVLEAAAAARADDGEV